jgi:hypothetical protein
VTRYNRNGGYGEEETYDITLENSGEILYTVV